VLSTIRIDLWARLRVLDGLRVARKRILRLMRENESHGVSSAARSDRGDW
jgi:hypothetical protein